MKTIDKLGKMAAAEGRRKGKEVDRTKGVRAAVSYLTKLGKLKGK
jgi:hypothetical protein